MRFKVGRTSNKESLVLEKTFLKKFFTKRLQYLGSKQSRWFSIWCLGFESLFIAEFENSYTWASGFVFNFHPVDPGLNPEHLWSFITYLKQPFDIGLWKSRESEINERGRGWPKVFLMGHFFVDFCSFQTIYRIKISWLQRESNSYCRSRRLIRWPLDQCNSPKFTRMDGISGYGWILVIDGMWVRLLRA